MKLESRNSGSQWHAGCVGWSLLPPREAWRPSPSIFCCKPSRQCYTSCKCALERVPGVCSKNLIIWSFSVTFPPPSASGDCSLPGFVPCFHADQPSLSMWHNGTSAALLLSAGRRDHKRLLSISQLDVIVQVMLSKKFKRTKPCQIGAWGT